MEAPAGAAVGMLMAGMVVAEAMVISQLQRPRKETTGQLLAAPAAVVAGQEHRQRHIWAAQEPHLQLAEAASHILAAATVRGVPPELQTQDMEAAAATILHLIKPEAPAAPALLSCRTQ